MFYSEWAKIAVFWRAFSLINIEKISRSVTPGKRPLTQVVQMQDNFIRAIQLHGLLCNFTYALNYYKIIWRYTLRNTACRCAIYY